MIDPDKLQTALTFDDVMLVPQKSDVLPKETDVSTFLTPNLKLNIPLVSAAMDTVTEARLAIALAQEGGLGIIHKNSSIEQQTSEVDKVKRSEAGMIKDPITLSPEKVVADALDIMKHYHISGIPIVQKDGKLVGIVTNRDLRFVKKMDLPLSAVMTKKNLVTVPVGTNLDKAEETLHTTASRNFWWSIRRATLEGLITIKDINKRIKFPNACKDLDRASEGGRGDFRFQGHGREGGKPGEGRAGRGGHRHGPRPFGGVLKTVALIRKKYPKLAIIAGNVVTGEAVKALVDAGADTIKVGVGPGSICTTRVVTGVGVPQIWAISECAKVAQKNKVTIIADGGIKYSGDITKAIAAGADAVMIGGLLAGTEESPGEVINLQGRMFKVYNGMGSLASMQKGRSADRYFQGEVTDAKKLVPEGIEARVPYRGLLSDLVYQLVGGLRAGMGYSGAKTIPDLKVKGHFVQITSAGYQESHPHDVVITKEAPNYYLD